MSRFGCTDCYRTDDLGKIVSFRCSPLGWARDANDNPVARCKCRKGCHAGAKSWATAIRQRKAA